MATRRNTYAVTAKLKRAFQVRFNEGPYGPSGKMKPITLAEKLGCSYPTLQRLLNPDDDAHMNFAKPVIEKFLHLHNQTIYSYPELYENAPIDERKQRQQEEIIRACEWLGISKIHPNGLGSPPPVMAEASEIRVISLVAFGWVNAYRSVLLKALTRGASLRILLANQTSQTALDILQMTEARAEWSTLIERLQITEANLAEFLEDAAKERQRKKSFGGAGKILIGRHTTEFECGLILLDSDWGWYTPHLPPLNLAETPSFELRPGEMLEKCSDHFNLLWQRAERANLVREPRKDLSPKSTKPQSSQFRDTATPQTSRRSGRSS